MKKAKLIRNIVLFWVVLSLVIFPIGSVKADNPPLGTIFATSTGYRGDIVATPNIWGSLYAADYACQQHANRAQLEGVWIALMSGMVDGQGIHMGDRIEVLDGADGFDGYKDINGDIIARTRIEPNPIRQPPWQDGDRALFGNTRTGLMNPIRYDENGDAFNRYRCAWTGSNTDGTYYAPFSEGGHGCRFYYYNDCSLGGRDENSWDSTSGGYVYYNHVSSCYYGTVNRGMWGNANSDSSTEWIQENTYVHLCDTGCSLYCVKVGPFCGNRILEEGEECEIGNLNEQTCPGLGFAGGDLECRSCEFYTADCLACGNNRVDDGEVCDGNDVSGESCMTLYRQGQADGPFGSLGCNDDCSAFETGRCYEDGDLNHVFVTDDTWTAEDIGGLAGAHQLCREQAEGLPGWWKAWVSVGNEAGENAGDYIFHRRDEWYVTIPLNEREVIIAMNWNDLADGDISNPITVNQYGERIAEENGQVYSVWTNTDGDGSINDRARTCNRLTSNEETGRVGDLRESDADWTRRVFIGCANQARLYCFQQEFDGDADQIDCQTDYGFNDVGTWVMGECNKGAGCDAFHWYDGWEHTDGYCCGDDYGEIFDEDSGQCCPDNVCWQHGICGEPDLYGEGGLYEDVPRAHTCIDDIDNDCDGLTDCSDSECHDPAHGLNDFDDDGRTDVCESLHCRFVPSVVGDPSPEEVTENERACYDGIDNDCDFSTDCDDESCYYVEDNDCRRYENLLDMDCDGVSDICEEECIDNPDIQGEPRTEWSEEGDTCDDGIDNDCDDATDCHDALGCFLADNCVDHQNYFIIQDADGENIASIDANGNMVIKGRLYNHQGNIRENRNRGYLDPPANSFILQDSDGHPMIYLDFNGNLYVWFNVAPGYDNLPEEDEIANTLLIQNREGETVVAFTPNVMDSPLPGPAGRVHLLGELIERQGRVPP